MWCIDIDVWVAVSCDFTVHSAGWTGERWSTVGPAEVMPWHEEGCRTVTLTDRQVSEYHDEAAARAEFERRCAQMREEA